MTADTRPLLPGRVEYGSTKVLKRRKFTTDELCEWFQVPPEPLPEPGHVMSRATFERIKQQK